MAIEQTTQPPQTLQELQDHFSRLYGRRNNIWLPGREPRLTYLNVAIRDLQKSIRHGWDDFTGIALARVQSRVFCVAHGLNEIPIARSMTEKFPISGCTYCKMIPCQCVENRADITVPTADSQSVQMGWNLRQWQRHLNLLYGEKNRSEGVEKIVNRIYEEAVEVDLFEAGEVQRDGNDRSADDLEKEYGLELADVSAWNIGVAIYLGIDLESEILKRYWPGCWKCKQSRCICTKFSFKEVRKINGQYL